MPLFGGGAEKAAQQAAAQAEFERLSTIPRPELAAEVMGVFADGQPGSKNPGQGLNILQVMMWLMSSQPRGTSFLSQLEMPVREALQLLENASLVIKLDDRIAGAHLTATTLGQQALAEGTVAQYLPH
jgi:hypothetical protein